MTSLTKRGERQPLEELVEPPPHGDALLAVAEALDALVKEAVARVDLGALVVAADQEDAVGVEALEREQEHHRLERVLAAVDVVAEEEVIDEVDVAALARGLAKLLEQAHEVAVLAVEVAKDLDRRRQPDQRRLALDDRLRLRAQLLDLRRRERERALRRRPPAARLQQPRHHAPVERVLAHLPRQPRRVQDALALLGQPVDRDRARDAAVEVGDVRAPRVRRRRRAALPLARELADAVRGLVLVALLLRRRRLRLRRGHLLAALRAGGGGGFGGVVLRTLLALVAQQVARAAAHLPEVLEAAEQLAHAAFRGSSRPKAKPRQTSYSTYSVACRIAAGGGAGGLPGWLPGFSRMGRHTNSHRRGPPPPADCAARRCRRPCQRPASAARARGPTRTSSDRPPRGRPPEFPARR